MNRTDIEDLVIEVIWEYVKVELAEPITVDSSTILFGEDGCLDSMGLVSILIDIEDRLSDDGIEIELTSARAMSRKHSPFASPATLSSYIWETLGNG